MRFVTWFTIPGRLRVRNLRIAVQGGTNVAVSQLGLHLGRVCFLLAMRGEASPEHLKRRMKCHSQSVRDRVQAEAQPIVRMNRHREWLSCTRLHPREHEGMDVRVRAPRPPQAT